MAKIMHEVDKCAACNKYSEELDNGVCPSCEVVMEEIDTDSKPVEYIYECKGCGKIEQIEDCIGLCKECDHEQTRSLMMEELEEKHEEQSKDYDCSPGCRCHYCYISPGDEEADYRESLEHELDRTLLNVLEGVKNEIIS